MEGLSGAADVTSRCTRARTNLNGLSYLFVFVFSLPVLATPPRGATPQTESQTDGHIISSTEYQFPSFEDSGMLLSSDIRKIFDEVEKPGFEKIHSTTDIQSIEYFSDGLKVRGFILMAKNVQPGEKLPILIYNRGGNRDWNKICLLDLVWLAKFAQKGYLVLASQYRGTDEDEGEDEFGGHEVNDVKNLIKLAKKLPYADKRNIFIAGHSRGGMESYLVLRKNHGIRAAAIMSGECDLKAGLRSRPDFEGQIYEKLIPNYKENRELALKKRSACFWAQDIFTPVFILQGMDDQAVDPVQAQMMADRLHQFNKTFKFWYACSRLL